MRIPINGVSMYPLIRRNRDMVTIMPLDGPFRIGDIVMFSDPRVSKRYVLHRVWQMDEDRVLTWGDNCDGPDAWMSRDCVWGRAVLIERGPKQIYPDAKKGLRLAKFWHRMGPLFRRGRYLAGAVKRRILKRIKIK